MVIATLRMGRGGLCMAIFVHHFVKNFQWDNKMAFFVRCSLVSCVFSFRHNDKISLAAA